MLYNIRLDYKINYQKHCQILEIYKVLTDHYEKEIKKIVKNKRNFLDDNFSTISNTPRKDCIDENDIVSTFSCGSSRKVQDKKVTLTVHQ